LLANHAIAYQISQNPLLANSLLQQRLQAAQVAQAQQVDPDVQELADHYGLDERITRQLDAELRKRPMTWEDDLIALWDILKDARSVPGMLSKKIEEMQENTFIGLPTADKDIADIKKKYGLDDQATRKLAEVLVKRPETRQQDIQMIHRHLETSNKPSARVMMVFGKLKADDTIPEPDKRIAPGSYLDKQQIMKEYKEKSGRDRRDRGRSRSRERRQRERSRSKSRDRRRSRSRDRSRDRRR